MKYGQENHGTGVLAVLAGLVLLPCAILALWIVVVFNSRYRTCVQLENGANLGFEAVFDLSRPYMKPIAVPRLEDGTPILRDTLWSIKITPTTIYGLSLEPLDERGYQFAWRNDVGLVLKSDNPVVYERLVAEAGQENWDVEIENVGTQWLMRELAGRPDFEVGRCPTSLVTW
ncbi:hypothetical protein [Rhodobacter sp. NSM]|uniref:hypothetical protein n=1 Tax=Rhodobacter sp. NSM TaxID=3457501 RepID=UPI003FD2AED6